MSRKTTTAWAGLLLACLCGCQLPQRFAFAKPAVHIGSTRLAVIGYVLVPSEFLALHPRLEQLFDAPVLFDPGLTPDSIAGHLAAGRMNMKFAILTAGEYAAIKDPRGLEFVAAATSENGSPMRKALLVTPAKSNVNTLTDLKGRRFAFGPAGDLLLDYAARSALRTAGLGENDIANEIPIPPVTFTNRIHVASGLDVAKAVAFDPTVAGGVVDEETFARLRDSGGSFLTGPSKEMFRVLGETPAVPGLVVVAGPKTEPVTVQKLRAFLVEHVKPATEPLICEQMRVHGFGAADEAAYAAARQMVSKT